MDERLEDALNVLKGHVEVPQMGLHMGPVGPHGSIYPQSSPQLEHLVNV